jgi:hypothetical protein
MSQGMKKRGLFVVFWQMLIRQNTTCGANHRFLFACSAKSDNKTITGFPRLYTSQHSILSAAMVCFKSMTAIFMLF